MLVAALIPVIVGLAGLGLDSARLYQAHSRLQGAVDAAALAASLELPYDPDMDQGLVKQAATTYLQKNYDAAELDSVASGAQARSVKIVAHATVEMMLLDVVGIASKTVTATATAGFNNLELVFVIDNSGSMKGSPINEANAAAESLVDLIIPEGKESQVKVGLVPFRGKVHVGADVDGLDAGCRNADGTYNWDLLDEYEGEEYRYPRGSRLNVSSGTCSSIPEITPLTSDRDAVVDAIYNQTATGTASGTVISEGLKWARYVLSPDAPYTQASSDDDMRKIIILLTDGDTEDGNCGGSYSVSYTPNVYWTNAYYGMGDMDSHCEDDGALNQAMLDEAQLAKDAGIEIFCVRYGSSDSTDVALMKSIASSDEGTDNHYFDAPSAYDLEDIFKKIGRHLGWRLLH